MANGRPGHSPYRASGIDRGDRDQAPGFGRRMGSRQLEGQALAGRQHDSRPGGLAIDHDLTLPVEPLHVEGEGHAAVRLVEL